MLFTKKPEAWDIDCIWFDSNKFLFLFKTNITGNIVKRLICILFDLVWNWLMNRYIFLTNKFFDHDIWHINDDEMTYQRWLWFSQRCLYNVYTVIVSQTCLLDRPKENLRNTKYHYQSAHWLWYDITKDDTKILVLISVEVQALTEYVSRILHCC